MGKSSWVFAVVLSFNSLQVFSQSNTLSPYSKYALGNLFAPNSFQNFAMGGTSIGLHSNRFINNLNPASYAAFNNTIFEAGVSNTALWLTDASEKQFSNSAYLDRLAFGFPLISNKWGMSFGMVPFSNVGYDYIDQVTDSIAGNIEQHFQGDGGINAIYLGNAFKFILDSTSLLSFGANASYLFGATDKKETITYSSAFTPFNLLDQTITRFSDLHFDMGLQYKKKFTSAVGENYSVVLGLTYGYETSIGMEETQTIKTFKGSTSFPETKDTILHAERNSTIALPSKYGVGIAFEKYRKWVVAVDYRMQNWSSILSGSSIFNYQDNYSLSGGVEFVPQYDAYNNYLKRVAYRFGVRYSTSYITINESSLSEYGITFGASLPMKRTETAIPRVSLGIEYGNRGETNNGSIQEQFLMFNLGISIMDRWFIKRKYD